jgi:ABC-type Fe3+ transport system substrate-binding protein
LATFDPSEAKNILPEARDPGRRWYGVYANYNTPSFNTQHVKPSELPQSYEEFVTRKEWAGKIAIDRSDNEWLKGIMIHFGEEKGTKLIKDIVANLNPVVLDGHLALARSVGSGEYLLALNQYLMLTMNVKLAGNPTDFWALDPVVLLFGQVGVNVKAVASQCRASRRQFHAQQGIAAVSGQVRPDSDTARCHQQPARDCGNAEEEKNHHGSADAG